MPDSPPAPATPPATTDSGALAPWLSYHVLDQAAAAIVKDLAGVALGGRRVLVTSDAQLLATDVFARQVRAAMAARATDLTTMTERLATARTALAVAVAAYRDEEAAEAHRAVEGLRAEATPPGGAGGGTTGATPAAGADAGDSASGDAAAATDAGGTTGGSPAGSAIDAAAALAKLVAVDYTMTAAEVPAEATLLATLVAGAVRQQEFPMPAVSGQLRAKVVLDRITVVTEDDPTFAAYAALTAAARAADAATLDLRRDLGPVTAEIDLLAGEADRLQTQWTQARADADAAPGGAAAIKALLEARRTRLIRRKDAAAPAQAVADRADTLLAAAAADLKALVTPGADGTTPLALTCARGGLLGATPKVDYVLYVGITHLGADVVTRHSVLGSSGRVGYLGSATTSWSLVETLTGQVHSGGATRQAHQLVHDLASGKTSGAAVPATATMSLPKDPQLTLETQIRWAVLVFALAIALLGVAATLNVFFG